VVVGVVRVAVVVGVVRVAVVVGVVRVAVVVGVVRVAVVVGEVRVAVAVGVVRVVDGLVDDSFSPTISFAVLINGNFPSPHFFPLKSSKSIAQNIAPPKFISFTYSAYSNK